jgi:CHASE3 domain sensor protein
MQIKIMWIFEFIVISILSVSIGWFYKTVLTNAQEEVAHTNDVIDSIDEIFILVVRSESAVKSYSAFGSQVYLDFYNQAKSNYPMMLLRLESMVKDNPKQIENLRDFHDAVKKKKEFLDNVIRLKKTDTLQSYQGQVQGKDLMDNVRKVYDRIKSEEYNLLNIRTERLKTYSDASLYIIPIFHFLNYVLLVSSYYTIKGIIDEHEKHRQSN